MRYFIAIALVFSFLGIANADSIPVVTDPKNQPTVWTQTVYNGSGSNITSGYAVIWDFDTSDTSGYEDMCAWVKLCNAAASPWTAGVVPLGYDLESGASGDIIVKGPAIMYDGGNTTTANTLVEADSSGRPTDETTTSAVDKAVLGVVIKATANGTVSSLGSNTAIIYVNPTYYENGN